MQKPDRPDPSPPPSGGGEWRPSLGYLAVAFAIVAAGLWFLFDPASSPTGNAADATASAAPASPSLPAQTAALPPAVSTAAPVESRIREGDNDYTPDLSSYVAPGEKPSMNEVIRKLNAAGVHSGLGAFSPPGTRPPMVGLAVPEDFVLPPGFVRHYQATDDGQRIEPILMFAPEPPTPGAPNPPAEQAKNRVVPPELAPPGMPIRRIVVPAPTEAGRPAL